MESTTEKNTVDIFVENYGSIFLFRPMTQAAREWIEQNVVGERQWFGEALAVESRYARDLAQGMANDGLRLK
jgi:hypothetical protein